MIYNT